MNEINFIKQIPKRENLKTWKLILRNINKIWQISGNVQKTRVKAQITNIRNWMGNSNSNIVDTDNLKVIIKYYTQFSEKKLKFLVEVHKLLEI